MHKEDLKLVKRLLNGDQRAFNQFYETYFPRIFRFCKLRVDGDEHCKDVVQQSLTAALRAIEGYRGEASLHTWLCQISRNEISKWYKKVGVKQEVTLSMDTNPELLAAIESVTGDIGGAQFDEIFDIRELVVTSLDQLPPNYTQVLDLKYIQGLSVEDMAHQLGTTAIAVQSLLARARKAFKLVFSDLHKQAMAG